jgi:hypothetical protein
MMGTFIAWPLDPVKTLLYAGLPDKPAIRGRELGLRRQASRPRGFSAPLILVTLLLSVSVI